MKSKIHELFNFNIKAVSKKILLSIAAFFISIISFANTGGPDQFGYIWKDSNEPGGPSYAWFDISQIGNPVTGLGDDNTIGPKPIGFNFQYYWYTVNKVWIGSNGYIGFDGPGNLASPFTNTNVHDYITGMMSDLTFLGSGNQARCYYYANADSFCVSWENVPFWAANTPYWSGANSFQIILNRADSSITVNIKNQIGFDYGGQVHVETQNNTGGMGLSVYNGLYPPINYTIKYYYPQNPSLVVTDGSVQWNQAFESPGVFLKRNGPPYTLNADIKNQGNITLPSFQVDADVLSLTNVVQVANSVPTNPLTPGQDTLMTFANTFNPTGLGTFKNRTRISGIVGDTLPINDSAVQEIVTIDTTQTIMTLNYNNQFTNIVGSSISWNGGSGGAGMYFKPPIYPARVVNTKMIMTSTTTSPYACYMKIYDDNGPGGAPGTLLDSVPVLATSVLTSQITTVPVSSNVVIASGGVYLLWDMGGLNASIGVDLTPPFSYQTFEVFLPFWSEYRDRSVQDFMLGMDVKKAFPEDVGVTRFVSPLNNATINSPTQVKVYIKNYGPQPDNNFINVHYKLGLSGNPVSQMYAGTPILPGDSVLFTFTTLLVPPYTNLDQLCAWTSKNTDINLLNDSVCINVNLVGLPEYYFMQHLSVYPNPTNGLVNFRLDENVNEAVSIEVRDIVGKLVATLQLENVLAGKENQIDLSKIAPGMYTYSIRSGDKFGTGKFIKEN